MEVIGSKWIRAEKKKKIPATELCKCIRSQNHFGPCHPGYLRALISKWLSHRPVYCILSLLSLHTVKKKEKIHRINVPENIVVIKKSVASWRAPPKTARPYSLKSAQLTCRREHGVLIHYCPQHDNGHLFCEAAFRSRRPTAVLSAVPWLWLDLKPNAGCWLANGCR